MPPLEQPAVPLQLSPPEQEVSRALPRTSAGLSRSMSATWNAGSRWGGGSQASGSWRSGTGGLGTVGAGVLDLGQSSPSKLRVVAEELRRGSSPNRLEAWARAAGVSVLTGN